MKQLMLATLLFLLAMSASTFGDDKDVERGKTENIRAANASEATYKIEAGLDGEIYPVLANYASLQKPLQRKLGVVSVKVSNPGSALLRESVSVTILGWSDQEIQFAQLGPGVSKTFVFAPTFLPRFYQNHEIVAATAQVTVTEASGQRVYETTVPVRLRSSEDMYWGGNFEYAPMIASWVTPHDQRVETILASAKNYLPDRRLPGYEGWKAAPQQEEETFREAKAIFNALKQKGLSYVKSSSTLGDHETSSERVRMPRTSLQESSANCIDAAVMYASLFENLGMDSTVVIVPGHAYAGVRVAAGSKKFLFLDVALTGRTSFEMAVASAERGLARYAPSSVTKIVISDARHAGIYPLP
ncbi:MAG TPA: hypothetical protein VKZ53_06290 [Candidatus Angelobacter sp.]|nr:hypothetical protein [Candidatus Angelobacter sp.]